VTERGGRLNSTTASADFSLSISQLDSSSLPKPTEHKRVITSADYDALQQQFVQLEARFETHQATHVRTISTLHAEIDTYRAKYRD
jgi:hypothetical protein